MITEHPHRGDHLPATLSSILTDKAAVKALGRAPTSGSTYRWFSWKEGRTVTGVAAVEFKKSGAWLRTAYILPEHRGKGIYAALLAHRVALCDEQDCPMITCVVTDDSKPRLVEQGFVDIGKRGKYTTMRRRVAKPEQEAAR